MLISFVQLEIFYKNFSNFWPFLTGLPIRWIWFYRNQYIQWYKRCTSWLWNWTFGKLWLIENQFFLVCTVVHTKILKGQYFCIPEFLDSSPTLIRRPWSWCFPVQLFCWPIIFMMTKITPLTNDNYYYNLTLYQLVKCYWIFMTLYSQLVCLTPEGKLALNIFGLDLT